MRKTRIYFWIIVSTGQITDKGGHIFKCEICGNVVIVKESGGGELVCCGEPMQLESE
jgi:desulfoferrodoxin-like iron-binding protein